MERIKQALERARSERLGLAPEKPASSSGAAPGETGEIAYTQTRTVEVSPEFLKKNRILPSSEPGPFADAYKILRTQILQRFGENNWSVLAVTSPCENEGKTVTAINLAICLAMEVNYSVLIVDANLQDPSVSANLGIENTPGLAEYLLDGAPLSELLVHPASIDHMIVLPSGRTASNSSELLNSPRMIGLVNELKTRYPHRIVIFDLPPVLSTSDAVAFAPYVDATLLVIEDGKTRRQDLDRTMDLLSCTTIVGTVLNKSQAKKA